MQILRLKLIGSVLNSHLSMLFLSSPKNISGTTRHFCFQVSTDSLVPILPTIKIHYLQKNMQTWISKLLIFVAMMSAVNSQVMEDSSPLRVGSTRPCSSIIEASIFGGDCCSMRKWMGNGCQLTVIGGRCKVNILNTSMFLQAPTVTSSLDFHLERGSFAHIVSLFCVCRSLARSGMWI